MHDFTILPTSLPRVGLGTALLSSEDLVSTAISLGVRLFDTAGLRGDAVDAVEVEGMRRAAGAAETAHVVVFVVDAFSATDAAVADAFRAVAKWHHTAAPRGGIVRRTNCQPAARTRRLRRDSERREPSEGHAPSGSCCARLCLGDRRRKAEGRTRGARFA